MSHQTSLVHHFFSECTIAIEKFFKEMFFHKLIVTQN